MRRFYLMRVVDATGVSGTGIVAEGVQFSDGQTVMRWLREPVSTGVYQDVQSLLAIHGHQGSTHIHWMDEHEQQDEPYKFKYCDGHPLLKREQREE